MKLIKHLFLIAFCISCKAQSPIVDLLDDDGSTMTNAYYKDVNNLLNPFEGTYVYTNGATLFKVLLVKKVQQFNGEYYEDLIIGEYQYIKDGVEKANTLSEITTNYNNQRRHSIKGNSIFGNNARAWKCPLCQPNERMLSAGIKDVSTNRFADFLVRKTTVNGQEAINIKITHVMNAIYNPSVDPEPLPFSLPLGEYTLMKL